MFCSAPSTLHHHTRDVMEAFLGAVGLRRLLHRPAGKAPKWSLDNVNQDVLNASYAVRGPVLDIAMNMEQRLKSGEALPFNEMIYCNIGTWEACLYLLWWGRVCLGAR